LFDALDEDEYQPTYEQNPYTENKHEETKQAGHPIGFGAERANLMEEQHVYMPV
jgi:hypothetical protein